AIDTLVAVAHSLRCLLGLTHRLELLKIEGGAVALRRCWEESRSIEVWQASAVGALHAPGAFDEAERLKHAQGAGDVLAANAAADKIIGCHWQPVIDEAGMPLMFKQ